MLFLAFLVVTAALMIVTANVLSGWLMVVLLICIGLGSLVIYANMCMIKDIYRRIRNGRKDG